MSTQEFFIIPVTWNKVDELNHPIIPQTLITNKVIVVNIQGNDVNSLVKADSSLNDIQI